MVTNGQEEGENLLHQLNLGGRGVEMKADGITFDKACKDSARGRQC